MNFFFHSELGAVYFIALTFVCAFALWRGNKDLRLFSCCLLGVFLADRTILATMDNETLMMALGGVVEFIALICVLLMTTNKIGHFIAFCFAAKIAMYMSLVSGVIGFETMAAWTELAGYGQLLVLAGGTINANRGKLVRRSHIDPTRNSGLVFSRKKGIQDK